MSHSPVPHNDPETPSEKREAGPEKTVKASDAAIAHEQQRAVDELRDSQARLSGIVDSAMDAIITVDSEQRILLFNRAAETMFGCPAAEAIGQTLERFVPQRFRAGHSSHVQ